MTRLKKISVVGFRGARFELPLDFTKDCKSIAIYGENAAGKSTITDALEWYLTGRVDHLWKEDCKEEALRHVLLEPDDICEVAVEFTDANCTNKRRLGQDLRARWHQQSAPFLAAVEKLGSEKIFLRHSQITQFVNESKSSKREELASIIGYETLTKFRDVIQSSLNALRKDTQFTAAKAIAENRKSDLFKLANELILTKQDLFRVLNVELSKHELSAPVSSQFRVSSAVEELRGKISHQSRAEKKMKLDRLVLDLTTIAEMVGTLRAEAVFLEKYNALVQEKENLQKINLQAFLASGLAILDAGNFGETGCPFCLSPYDLNRLREEVDTRIAKIRHLADQLQSFEVSLATLLTAIEDAGKLCTRIATDYTEFEQYKSLCADALHLRDELRRVWQECRSRFRSTAVISCMPEVLKQLSNLVTTSEPQKNLASCEAQKLEFSTREKELISSIELINRLDTGFEEYRQNKAIAASFESQIASLEVIFRAFVQVQNTTLQLVLDQISEDVREYYKFLHPEENVSDVHLRIVGEEGVEFEYTFHGKPRYPPRKFLSESHLNSLGIVLFLASAKLFNVSSKFFVLDDIVTSFDVGHRRRLLRLLKGHFQSWQIILLTHESFWFDMIKREMLSAGWLAREVCWDQENGIQLEPSPADLRALIAKKRPKFDVSNDLRKLLESTLKELCYSLEVKLTFRYNDENERRMSGELLSELRATINRKCPTMKGNPIFASLEGSNLVATTGSHDNQESIVGGDIDVALGDIDTLVGMFSCAKCGGWVRAESTVPGRNAIACRCGNKEIEWKV